MPQGGQMVGAGNAPYVVVRPNDPDDLYNKIRDFQNVAPIFVPKGHYVMTKPLPDLNTCAVIEGVAASGKGIDAGGAYLSAANYGTIIEFQLAASDFCWKTIATTSPNSSGKQRISNLTLYSQSGYANLGLLKLNIVSSLLIENVGFDNGYLDGPCIQLGTLNGNLVHINKCGFSGVQEDGSTPSGNGIYGPTGSGGGVDHLRLRDCDFFFCKHYGIRLTGSSSFNVFEGLHMGSLFDLNASQRFIYLLIDNGSAVFRDIFFEANPNTVDTATAKFMDVSSGSLNADLVMQNVNVTYADAVDQASHIPNTFSIGRWGGGNIETFVRCLNHTTSAETYGKPTIAVPGAAGYNGQRQGMKARGYRTGTGAGETFAHGLCDTPTHVTITPDVTGATVTSIWADANNINCTVTNAKTYYWYAEV